MIFPRLYSPISLIENCSLKLLPITNYQLPITNYQLPITHYPFSNAFVIPTIGLCLAVGMEQRRISNERYEPSAVSM